MLHLCPLQLGKYDLAIQDYTKALEVDPANSFAYYNRGITKDRMGDFEGAVADFSSAITLDPGNADFYHNRGFSLRKQVGLGTLDGNESGREQSCTHACQSRESTAARLSNQKVQDKLCMFNHSKSALAGLRELTMTVCAVV